VDWGLHKHACKYNPDSCEVCGEREGLQSCAGCLHRKYCCAEHQKEAWKDHKALCNVYRKRGLASTTDPEQTVKSLLDYSQELTLFGREFRPELALRVNMEILATTKHFGFVRDHSDGLLATGGALMQMEKFDEAEIFARDAVDFAREELGVLDELKAASLLSKVLLMASKVLALPSKARTCIEICDVYLELLGTQDAEEVNAFRVSKSKALSLLGRHEEALGQLSYVPTTKCGVYMDWVLLSDAQHTLGRLPEAIKSAEKALELARVGDASASAAMSKVIVAHACNKLASLYQLGGRAGDARKLRREAEKL
jgi:tetratricopeptide (TPR) repeat protein